MKNGKVPTLAQKKFLKEKGLDPDAWLVVKSTNKSLEVVSRIALKKQRSNGTKPRIRRICKEI